jgi:hypothetical protein
VKAAPDVEKSVLKIVITTTVLNSIIAVINSPQNLCQYLKPGKVLHRLN